MLPEFKTPTDKRADVDKHDSIKPPEWEWGGDETMHPFWAAKRLTAAQLKRLRDQTKVGTQKPRFNCALTDFTMSVVAIAAPHGSCVNTTRNVVFQALTNTVPVRKGEELILEIAAKKSADPKPKRTLREALNDEGKTSRRPNDEKHEPQSRSM